MQEGERRGARGKQIAMQPTWLSAVAQAAAGTCASCSRVIALARNSARRRLQCGEGRPRCFSLVRIVLIGAHGQAQNPTAPLQREALLHRDPVRGGGQRDGRRRLLWGPRSASSATTTTGTTASGIQPMRRAGPPPEAVGAPGIDQPTVMPMPAALASAHPRGKGGLTGCRSRAGRLSQPAVPCAQLPVPGTMCSFPITCEFPPASTCAVGKRAECRDNIWIVTDTVRLLLQPAAAAAARRGRRDSLPFD